MEVAVLLTALVVAALFVPQVHHFATRNRQQRVVSRNLPLWRTLETVETSLYDARFAARGPVRPRCYDKIAIVAVDPISLQQMGQWPWPRSWHAQLVRRLKQAGAKTIVLDFDFSDKQMPHSYSVRDSNTGSILRRSALSASDRELIAAVHDSGNVVLPSPMQQLVTSGLATGQVEYNGWRVATPFSADEQVGTPGLDDQTVDESVSYLPERGGGARDYPMRASINGATIGSVAALAAGIYERLLDGQENARYEALLKSGTWPTLQAQVRSVPLVRRVLDEKTDDDVWLTPLYFWGPAGTFQTDGYAPVLNLDGSGLTETQMRQRFAGRIVFVGATAEILKDIFSVPVFEGGSDQMSGVELHATATAMLLDGQYLETASTASTLWSVFGLTLLSGLWISLLRDPINGFSRRSQARWSKTRFFGRRPPFRIQFVLWLALYILLSPLPIVLFWQACKWLFIHRNLWVIAVYPLASASLASALSLLLHFGSELGLRHKQLTQFGFYMPPVVLDEVLAHPEEDYGRTERKWATVLFTDLEGFTTYSEGHEPEQVVITLNRYLSYMMPIVDRYGGTFDKYIGDAIMAYFGAPIPVFDHASRALLCAVEMQEACARFRKDTGVPFYMRIGIHTGDLLCGSMGSCGDADTMPRLNYTVIGDTVNVASRLEGKNKEFGSWIMCSADTYFEAPDVVEAEPALAQVKGKTQTVEVYVVHGLHGLPEQDHNWGRELTSEERERIAAARAAARMPELAAPMPALPAGQAGTMERPTIELANHEESIR